MSAVLVRGVAIPGKRLVPPSEDNCRSLVGRRIDVPHAHRRELAILAEAIDAHVSLRASLQEPRERGTKAFEIVFMIEPAFEDRSLHAPAARAEKIRDTLADCVIVDIIRNDIFHEWTRSGR